MNFTPLLRQNAFLALTDRQEPISRVGRKSNTDKVLVVIAVEMLEPKGLGRIRLRRIADDSAACVIPFVQEAVEPGAEVRTDGSAAYRSLGELGYEHRRTVMLGSDVPAHVSMAGVHRVASLIKRWILGTHHGSVQPEHLDAYLNEFVFRFNRRTSASRGMLFYRLLQQAVVTEPVTYEDVVRKKPTSARRKSILDGHMGYPLSSSQARISGWKSRLPGRSRGRTIRATGPSFWTGSAAKRPACRIWRDCAGLADSSARRVAARARRTVPAAAA